MNRYEGRTAAIRENIERTRGEMSRTVNELEERLSPARLKEQVREQASELADEAKAKAMEFADEAKAKALEFTEEAKAKVKEEIQEVRAQVREATVGKVEHMVHDARVTVTDAGEGIVAVIKANPIPAALVAVGLGWLFVNARSDSMRRMLPYRPDRYGDVDNRRFGSYGYDSSTRGSDFVHDASQRGRELVHDASERGREFVQGAGERGREWIREAGEFVEGAEERGRELVHDAGIQFRRAERTVENTLRENPLAVGAIAVAVGAAVGLALPHTRPEDEWFGGMKEKLVDKAEQVAGEAIHKVESAAVTQLGGPAEDEQQQPAGGTPSERTSGNQGKNGVPASKRGEHKSPSI